MLGGAQQMIDRSLALIAVLIINKLSCGIRIGNDANQIQVEPSKELSIVRSGRRTDSLGGESLLQTSVDGFCQHRRVRSF